MLVRGVAKGNIMRFAVIFANSWQIRYMDENVNSMTQVYMLYDYYLDRISTGYNSILQCCQLPKRIAYVAWII